MSGNSKNWRFLPRLNGPTCDKAVQAVGNRLLPHRVEMRDVASTASREPFGVPPRSATPVTCAQSPASRQPRQAQERFEADSLIILHLDRRGNLSRDVRTRLLASSVEAALPCPAGDERGPACSFTSGASAHSADALAFHRRAASIMPAHR